MREAVSEFLRETLVALSINPEMLIWGNETIAWAEALAIAVLAAAVFAVVQHVVIIQLKKLAGRTHTDLDDTLINLAQSIRPSFYWYAAIYIGLLSLDLPAWAGTVLTAVLLVWVAVQIVLSLQRLIDYFLARRARKEEDPGAVAAMRYIGMMLKWSLWVMAILAILANFGINITSILAGLGVAGIAVGLALQNILGDLFSSFAIYFDKPFQVGDFIVVGEHMGTVENIGIKTTRIRALQGEEIVISNAELTSSRVQNFRLLKERRAAFSFGILYETPLEKVRRVPELVKHIVEGIESVRLDRAHFFAFGDSSLDFEVVYYVVSQDYNEYMDAQQEINLALMAAFEQEGIGFAYPTRTVYLQK